MVRLGLQADPDPSPELPGRGHVQPNPDRVGLPFPSSPRGSRLCPEGLGPPQKAGTHLPEVPDIEEVEGVKQLAVPKSELVMADFQEGADVLQTEELEERRERHSSCMVCRAVTPAVANPASRRRPARQTPSIPHPSGEPHVPTQDNHNWNKTDCCAVSRHRAFPGTDTSLLLYT